MEMALGQEESGGKDSQLHPSQASPWTEEMLEVSVFQANFIHLLHQAREKGTKVALGSRSRRPVCPQLYVPDSPSPLLIFMAQAPAETRA